jgi:protein gp37
MKNHKIGWLNVPGYIPQTWNPIVGCSKISEGCRNCYAERMANRQAAMCRAGSNTDSAICYRAATHENGGWNGTTHLIDSAIKKPMGWKKPRAIFVNSMGDLFHENTSDEWIDQVFAVMALFPQHLFIVLTKRAERMEKYISGGVMNKDTMARVAIEASKIKVPVSVKWPLPNVWMGVTAENQEMYDSRIRHLLATPAAVRFVSGEPLLSEIHADYIGQLDWFIVGGESGPGARAMQPEWARALRDQCEAAGVPFFFKQWGSAVANQIGKGSGISGRKGGDILGGCQWHQWPRAAK